MHANVNQHCPSCGTEIYCDAEISELFGVDVLTKCTATWDCPNCGVGYEQTTPVDTDVLDRSGFHSWVGEIGDEMACIVVADGANVVDD